MTFICGQPWRDQYPFNDPGPTALGEWTVDTSLPSTRVGAGALLTKNRVYLLGGVSGSTTLSTVLTAPVDSGGLIGAWTTDANSLPAALAYASVLMTDHRVYLIGGHTGSASTAAVLTAEIGADGVIGSWTTDANSLPGPLHGSALVVTTDRVYLLGGFVDGTEVGTVYTAAINPDGTLGAWSAATSLPVTRSLHAAFATESYVYLLMDYSDASVYRAPINGDGTIGTWAAHSTVLTWARSPLLTAREKLWMIGGNRTSTRYSTVRTAAIDAADNMGSWGTDASLPAAKVDSMVVATSSRVYAIGGSGTTPVNSVYSAAWSGGANDYLSKTVEPEAVPVLAALTGIYGLYEAHLESCLVGWYHLLRPVSPAALIGLYGMLLEQGFVGRYGDAPQLLASLIGRYGNAPLVNAALIGRYGDLVQVAASLEGCYHLMHARTAALVGEYAICGIELLAGLVGRYDLRERDEIMAALEGYYSLLPGATIQQVACPVRIGGVAVRWAGVSWTISEDSYLIEATILLRDVGEFNSIAKLDTVEIDWAGSTYHLFVAAKLRSRSISSDAGAAEYGAEYTIIARSLTAGLDAPYALPITRSWPTTTLASAIAADLISPLADILTLDFRLEDWLQLGGTFFVTDESPLDGLRKLAAIVGGIIQTSPDNTIILRPGDTVPPSAWGTTAPAWTIEDSGLFSDSESEEESSRYNVITVTNQSESNTSTRFEVEDITDLKKRVRGYRVPWVDFGLTTSGGAWVTIEDGGVVEEQVVDELVEFIDGTSSASKPIYSQVQAVWLQSSLGTIIAAEDGSLTSTVVGNSLAKITYTTRCHVWIGTSDRSEEVQFYGVDL